jgi:hypothetical protein
MIIRDEILIDRGLNPTFWHNNIINTVDMETGKIPVWWKNMIRRSSEATNSFFEDKIVRCRTLGCTRPVYEGHHYCGKSCASKQLGLII